MQFIRSVALARSHPPFVVPLMGDRWVAMEYRSAAIGTVRANGTFGFWRDISVPYPARFLVPTPNGPRYRRVPAW